MLTQSEIELVKSTIPILESGNTAITSHFYQRMFEHNPELKHVFNLKNQAKGTQQTALFNAVLAYAKNIDNLAVLQQAVSRIAHKHTSLNIQAEHYPIVGHHLIETFRELTGDLFTPELEAAWTKAYQQLAEVFIGIEGDLYQQSAQKQGGWQGARKFILVEKRIESELVKSLVFEPADGGLVAEYKPGQYIGIQLSVAGQNYRQVRQYSLSGKANKYSYQISVKREIIEQPGIVSNYLHDGLRLGDQVELFAPSGDFYFEDKQSPVVLISAGVGLTPMQSMLETFEDIQYSQSIYNLHACQNVYQHSFKRRNEAMALKLRLTNHVWYQDTNHADCKQEALHKAFYEHHGFMDIAAIADTLPMNSADFYLCGPVGFMRFAKQQLLTLRVDEAKIHYEVFGPHADL